MPNILLTRPRDRSEAFAKRIETCGWTSTIWPLLTIHPIATEPIKPTDRQSLIFTSVNAIETMLEPAPIHAPAICVGMATAAAARKRGFSSVADVSGDAHKLIETLLGVPPRPYLHVRGADTRGDIAATLTQAGRPTDEVITYQAVAANHTPEDIETAMIAGKINAIALFSPRSAAILTKLIKTEWLPQLSSVTMFAISPSAAEPAQDMGFANVVVAKQPNGSAMCAAICSATNG